LVLLILLCHFMLLKGAVLRLPRNLQSIDQVNERWIFPREAK
jgi:hypothetical protein